ncbi:MAG: S8 family serine peptidase [Lewinellaceae bacterium]|nr:S8 family serine peptidase [Lewinellaceae bacterium]
MGLGTPEPNEFDPLVYHVSVPDNRLGKALYLADSLRFGNHFAFAEADFLLVLRKMTNDPAQIAQWSQDNDGRYWNGNAWVYVGDDDADMDVEPAWNITTGSSSIKIAVIDEGVDLDHPDLIGNMLAGYDATGLGSGGNPSGDDAHGTACAGIIAAVANNSIGIAGNAYGCKIIPIRIAYTPAGQTNWYTTTSWQANAINWAWQTAGADILSNSWGGGSPSSLVSSAITNAVNNGRAGKGSPVLFSAGNDDQTPVSYPSFYSNVISVGASSMCDERKSPDSCDGETGWGSNYGTGLDIVAPGVKIATCDIAGTAGYNGGDYTYSFNGTSSACPNAAGAMALILSVNPNLTQTQARSLLELSCERTGDYLYETTSGQPNGPWNNEMGYGRVNALIACIAATGYCPGFGNSTEDEWIASVSIGANNNVSGNNLGYGYFTNLNWSFTQGQSYPLTLSPGYTSTAYDEFWTIWIDFNKDGDFNDAGELVYDSGAPTAGDVTSNMAIPFCSGYRRYPHAGGHALQ